MEATVAGVCNSVSNAGFRCTFIALQLSCLPP